MLFALVCAVLLFAGSARAGDDLDLDSSNFQDTVDANDYVLAMFYAPWCGHCKSFKPHFAAAATKAKGKYVLAKIDCTQDSAKDLCQEHEVRGYPTVKFFKHGVASEYTGPRDTEGVLNWLDRKTGPPARTIKESEVAPTVAEVKGVAVVGFFAKEDNEEHKEFIEAAGDPRLDEFKFFQVFGSGAADGTVRLFVQHETAPHVYPGGTTSKELATWLFQSSFPLVDEVGGHNFQKYVQLGKPLHLVFIEPSDANLEQHKKDLATVAAEHRDHAFTWIDAVKYRQNIKGMGASGNVVPCIIFLRDLQNQAESKPVVFEDTLNLEAYRKWAAGIKSGVYKYVPKSEPIPEDNSGPVKVIVGKTWDEIVNDETKNVLVEFYAPWCGHCKQLAPKYEELGKKFEASSDFVISKIDGTANDVESHYQIKGFPTLLLYTKTGKDKPIVYEGLREVDDIEKWLKTHQ